MATMAVVQLKDDSHLRKLSDSFSRTAGKAGQTITTLEFIDCCDAILPFFDHLGPVFGVARGEFATKLTSVREAGQQHATLHDLVAADKAAKTATVKNSPTRNLHRLLTAIQFIQMIFFKLCANPAATLREVAGEAYEATLAPFHTGIIRGVVRAGMYTLPSRQHFLETIGETEETAKDRAHEVTAACTTVVTEVQRLFADIKMPVSDVWLWPKN